MGLKCSVLGHKYGEATVEREREEQGSEVVITIQEQETCERCGNTRIVSENKEVTSIETPSDIAGDVVEQQRAAAESGPDESATSVAEQPATSGTGEPATPDAGEASGGDDAVTPVFEEHGDQEQYDEEAMDPRTDDAEIMDDSEETGSSGDAELDAPTTSVEVPDAEDEVVDEPDPDEDDGVIIDDDERPADDGRAPGEWPEEPGGDDSDWTPETVLADDDGEDSPDVEPAGGSAVTVPEGTFYCDECGFTTDVESSSLRAGDFCPECHKGALVQQSGE